MCFYSQLTKDALTIAQRFRVKFNEPEKFSPSSLYNGFEHPSTPVIADYAQDKIHLFNWGLIPHWSNDINIRRYTLNARIEDLENIKSFKDSINNRCLVISDGFFEWKEIIYNGKKKKIRHLITLEDGSLFAFAGLYTVRRNNSGEFHNGSYTIITTEANEVVREIAHKKMRMPVILRPSDENYWLSGVDHRGFAFPYSCDLRSITLECIPAENKLF